MQIPPPIDESGRRTAIDGAARRRVYLFRHGAVSYFDEQGDVVSDTNLVDLNETGRSQAATMREAFARVPLDRVIHSGLPRTEQTAALVLNGHSLEAEPNDAFREIQEFKGEFDGDYDVVADIAFSHQRAVRSDARFLGGELYHEFYERVASAFESLMLEAGWHNLALFAHGGTNAAILGWVTGLGPAAFGVFDQATCCVNVIDVDVDANGEVVRRTLRATNVTAEDPVKRDRHCGDMESMARWLIASQARGK